MKIGCNVDIDFCNVETTECLTKKVDRMKNVLFFSLAALVFVSCSKIPDTPIWNEISTDELAAAIDQEPDFATAYEAMKALSPNEVLSDTQKAKYKDLTWRRYYEMTKYANDSTVFGPLKDKWTKEWNETMAKDLAKVDSLMEYWANYKKENSLSRFVTADVVNIKKTYYSYIHSVDDIYFVFEFNPLVENVEQFKFNYSYNYKINSGRGRGEKHNCIYSSPLRKKDTGWYKVSYSEKDKLEDETFTSFMQAHDFRIEITDVRVNGKNYSLDDLNIPEAVNDLWDMDTERNRDEVAKLINPQYENLESYLATKKNETLEKKDAKYMEFTKEFAASAVSNIFKNLGKH